MSFGACWPRRLLIPDARLRSAAAIASAVRSRELSCREVTEAALEQARAAHADLNCFVEISGESALREASRLDQALAAGGEVGLLAGVPFAVKDIFTHEGRRPTSGSRRVHLQSRAPSSPALERLTAAGAVRLGWLNLDQFSYTATGFNPDFGGVRNPWDPARLAGGSSSGAAAAVAAGAVPVAIGADTGGSVRIPAAYCGVVGLKPTLGRVPRRGAAPLGFSQDALGILARSVTDTALVLEVLAGHDPLDPASVRVEVPSYTTAAGDDPDGLSGIRVGFDDSGTARHCSAEIQSLATRALDVMAIRGAELVAIDLGRLSDYDVMAAVLTWAEASAIHSATFPLHRDDYAPVTRARLDAALLCSGADHVNALRWQGRALREFLRDVLSRVDVVAYPTVPDLPPLLAAGSTHSSLAALRLNRPFSLLGLPAMSVPVGFDPVGLPVGLQLISRPWAEQTLLRAGAAYQAITDWHLRIPPGGEAQAGVPSG